MPYYEDEAVVIHHGDSRELAPTLGRFDLVLTDPPYGFGYGNARRRKHGRLAAKLCGDWDDEIPDVRHVFEYADTLIIWGGERFSLPVSRGWLAWIKPNSPPSFSDFELAWSNMDIPYRSLSIMVGSFNKESLPHPTQKPERLMKWCISLAGDGVKTILDPYAGSGTTGRAAKDMGRKAVLIEMDERYCEMAATRMAQSAFDL